MNFRKTKTFTYILISAIFVACNSKDKSEFLPVLAPLQASSITCTSAEFVGTVVTDGGSGITARGVCWAITHNPTIANSKSSNGTGSGEFTSAITGLTTGNTYYVRSYATNANGTAYGEEYKLTTASLPTLTTAAVSSITALTAVCGGTVTSDGGTSIQERGICWATTPNPTIGVLNTTHDDSGTGSFTSDLSGLKTETTYYVRAYATNEFGTSYGASFQFKTLSIINPNLTYGTVKDIDGNTYKTITIGTQTWMAENLRTTKYRNGESITNISDNTAWNGLTTGAWCYYENDANRAAEYGKFYNWYAVNDSRNLAPAGWHVTTAAEWTLLENYINTHLGTSTSVSQALAANYGWNTDLGTGPVVNNMSLNNSSGFSALPCGYRLDDNNIFTFYYLGIYAGWWFTNEYDEANALSISLRYNDNNLKNYNSHKNYGLAVRCVKD